MIKGNGSICGKWEIACRRTIISGLCPFPQNRLSSTYFYKYCKLFLDIPVDERIIFIVIAEHLFVKFRNNSLNEHPCTIAMVAGVWGCVRAFWSMEDETKLFVMN